MMASIALDLGIALTAAFMTYMVTLMTKWYKARREEKDLPVAGKYLTAFEDEVNGETVLQKSLVELIQNGRSVTGESALHGRVWVLEGEVTKDGYLHGRYYAKELRDKGMGNFFLEVHDDGDMSGFWSGYDSVNRKIVSGKYYFFKDIGIEIRDIKKDDLPAIMRIAEQRLGDAYIDPDTMRDRRNIRKCALCEDKIAGFCVGWISQEGLTKSERWQQMETRSFDFIDEYGYLGSLAVDEEYSGRGIGTMLMQSCIEEFREYDIKHIFMTAWKSSDGIHIAGMADRLGFEQVTEVPDFWKEQSLEEQFRCPECGDPPCTCTAVVYHKSF